MPILYQIAPAPAQHAPIAPARHVPTLVAHLRCPACQQGPCGLSSELSEPSCPACGYVFHDLDGIYDALPPDRESIFRQFVHDYEFVRAKEGRGSGGADHYLALPFKDLDGRNVWQWRIRARTFRFMEKHLLPNIEHFYPRGFDVLDVGAGNGWLSYRLAQRGHRPVAVDLLVNDTDGLGAARHYFHLVPPFLRFKAEMDRLPFMPAQFDVVIFNASLHYSEDYRSTLQEALRCLRKGGHLIVADSPFYWREESGQKMVQEKRAAYSRQFGFSSDSIQSREYLTTGALNDLAADLAIKWRVYQPWYGLSWTLRPLKARLLRRREPSKFYLLHAKVEN
ncbi:MAG TPA: class I SAM-dependent methyltransferase [Candidatus Sulfotelmatobacter sp.]